MPKKAEAYQSCYDPSIFGTKEAMEERDKNCLLTALKEGMPWSHSEWLRKLNLTEEQALDMYNKMSKKAKS